ncbi:MAG TPA: phosphoribosyltransferase family protein [Nitrospirota bacterium]|nr:phosphoribosyltransferase family protein [Nitrospirota bacterium]
MFFQNRSDAGERLAGQLKNLQLQNPIVLAIPRGGAPVGAAVARALSCPFDIIPLIKIPIPWDPEASYGVVVMDGTVELNKPLVNRLELSDRELEMAESTIMIEVKRREQLYRQGKPFPVLENRSVIITDDGMATGYSMLAAAAFVNKRKPHKLIVALPVAAQVAQKLIASEQRINQVVILAVDYESLFSLPSYYEEFTPITDDDVLKELHRL